ncbi:Slx4p interacting protein, partial [Podochytrium sp. JEL0797]
MGFYACYLLNSQQPGKETKAYVGSTPDPVRRIRQHNGEIQGGAKKTAKLRPWAMVLVVFGFPSSIAALQFEWAWQKPFASRHVKTASKRQDLAAKLAVLAEMLDAEQWIRWPLKVHITCGSVRDRFVKLRNVNVSFGTLRELPFRSSLEEYVVDRFAYVEAHRTRCSVCSDPIDTLNPPSFIICPATPGCTMAAHLSCLARHLIESENSPVDEPFQIIPVSGPCPECEEKLSWGDLITCQQLYHNAYGGDDGDGGGGGVMMDASEN